MSEDLGFRITGDNSPIKRTMAGLSPYFQEAGKKFSDRFKIGWAAGMAAVAGATVLALGQAVRQAMSDATTNVKEAVKLGIGIEDFQLLKQISDETGTSVEKLVETLKGGGDSAERLREQMEGIKKLFGTQSEAATAGLVQLNDVLDIAWNKFKQIAGEATVFAGRVINGIAGMWEGVFAVLKTGDISQFTEKLSDRLARSETAGDTAVTRRRVEAGEALIAEKRKDRAEKAKKTAEEAKKTLAKEQGQVLVKAPQADALSQVGLFTGRAAFERSQYEQQSLSYLETIARNTGATGAAGPPQVAT
jgi:hypothetical protein